MKEQIPKKASTRTICGCLSDMRDCLKVNNFSYLGSLIEEVQYRANRMENALEIYGGWDGVPTKLEELHKLKAEIKKLEKKRDELNIEIDPLED